MRKIIQISEPQAQFGSIMTLALCDDGTVWAYRDSYHRERNPEGGYKWTRLIDIPQDEEQTPRTFGP
jgi:hypothetical protein